MGAVEGKLGRGLDGEERGEEKLCLDWEKVISTLLPYHKPL